MLYLTNGILAFRLLIFDWKKMLEVVGQLYRGSFSVCGLYDFYAGK